MSIPVLQGRTFTSEDRAGRREDCMINQALAQRDFPDEDPVGKRITLGNTDENNQPIWFEIIGVTANVRSQELREEAPPELYFSAEADCVSERSLLLFVRQSIRKAVAPALRQAVAEVDRTVPVADVRTMEHIVSESVTQPRFNLFLLGLFGAHRVALIGRGHLRSDCLHGHAAHARDGHSARARRSGQRRVEAGPGPGNGGHCHRFSRWSGGFVCVDAPDEKSAVWCR